MPITDHLVNKLEETRSRRRRCPPTPVASQPHPPRFHFAFMPASNKSFAISGVVKEVRMQAWTISTHGTKVLMQSHDKPVTLHRSKTPPLQLSRLNPSLPSVSHRSIPFSYRSFPWKLVGRQLCRTYTAHTGTCIPTDMFTRISMDMLVDYIGTY